MILEIGFGGSVAADKVLAIIDANTAPAKRLAKQAEAAGKLVCATKGRKSKSLIILQGMVVVQCAYKDASIGKRLDSLTQIGELISGKIGYTDESADEEGLSVDENEDPEYDDDLKDDFELDEE